MSINELIKKIQLPATAIEKIVPVQRKFRRRQQGVLEAPTIGASFPFQRQFRDHHQAVLPATAGAGLFQRQLVYRQKTVLAILALVHARSLKSQT
jgi:hypothetical protein